MLNKKIMSILVPVVLLSASPSYSQGVSDASALSLLPVAVSVAASGKLLSAGAGLSVVAVENSAAGVRWVIEQASNGVRGSVEVSSQVAKGVAVGVGTAVGFSAVSTGWVLLAAGKAVAFVPNEIGKALLHNEKVSL